MAMGMEISLAAAFVAGLLSFLSPCVLPLVPVYVAQMAEGVSQSKDNHFFTPGVFLRAIIFVSGFTLVFVALGAATGIMGKVITANRDILLKVGGAFVILMGINHTGLLRLTPFARHWLPLDGFRRRGKLGPFFLGMVFGLGWTPCVGPVLASILTLATITGTASLGGLLLAVYSLGMAIPFLMLSFAFDRLPGLQGALSKHSGTLLRISGLLLIILGLLMFFNKFYLLGSYLSF